MSRHKETFYQAAFQGIPAHWVVQFYIDDNPFPEAAYFSSEEDAVEFEQELINEHKDTESDSPPF